MHKRYQMLEMVLERSKDMIGLLLAIFIFNFIAYKYSRKKLTKNQIVHIIAFTIGFQMTFDLFIEFKYHGYWYFSKEIDYRGLVAHLLVVPPVNVMFISWYPFHAKLRKQLQYLFIWEIVTLSYELLALLPEPFGYFHYGWWNLLHSIIMNPILFLILILYFKWIKKLEEEAMKQNERGIL